MSRRGPVADVTPDDRALVDRFLDMMAAEAGSSRHTLAAYRNDLERAAESLVSLGCADGAEVSKLGARWAELPPPLSQDAPRHCGGSSDSLSMMAFGKTIPRRLCPARAWSDHCPASLIRATSSECSKPPRTGQRAASWQPFATLRSSNSFTVPACAPPSWSACHAARFDRASPS